nr:MULTISPECIES: TetR family transcriptional regulator [Nocardiopsis]
MINEITDHGIRSVTLARISTRTGLAIGSIRHYFGNTLGEVSCASRWASSSDASRTGTRSRPTTPRPGSWS